MASQRVKIDVETGAIKVRVGDGLYENREQVVFAALVALSRDYTSKYDNRGLEVIQNEFLDEQAAV